VPIEVIDVLRGQLDHVEVTEMRLDIAVDHGRV
jgi:hypothetical protein